MLQPHKRVSRSAGATADWPECEEFYNLMQRYRHVNQHNHEGEEQTVLAYEEVKAWLRLSVGIADFTIPASIRKPTSGPCTECGKNTENKYGVEWIHDECKNRLYREHAEDIQAKPDMAESEKFLYADEDEPDRCPDDRYLDDPRRGQADDINRRR